MIHITHVVLSSTPERFVTVVGVSDAGHRHRLARRVTEPTFSEAFASSLNELRFTLGETPIGIPWTCQACGERQELALWDASLFGASTVCRKCFAYRSWNRLIGSLLMRAEDLHAAHLATDVLAEAHRHSGDGNPAHDALELGT